MEKRYANNDERLGGAMEFTMTQMVAQYKMCGWDEYEDESGIAQKMTDEEIEADILKHDIVEL